VPTRQRDVEQDASDAKPWPRCCSTAHPRGKWYFLAQKYHFVADVEAKYQCVESSSKRLSGHTWCGRSHGDTKFTICDRRWRWV